MTNCHSEISSAGMSSPEADSWLRTPPSNTNNTASVLGGRAIAALTDAASRSYAWPVTPDTRYARAGDVHIAYQVLGEGPVDVVLADQWFSNMDGQWDVPPLAEFRRRLASFSRLIM